MRKNLTEIVFILDRSGSMSGLEQDTIGGIKSSDCILLQSTHRSTTIKDKNDFC